MLRFESVQIAGSSYRAKAEGAGRRYEVTQEVGRNTFELRIFLTREPGEDEATLEYIEFPMSSITREAVRRVALEAACQFEALTDDYDPERHDNKSRLVLAVDRAYKLHRGVTR